jgi:hypothetical protein
MVPFRAHHEPAHLAYLEKHRDEIVMAGGLRNEHGGPYVGGLSVFDVSSRDRTVALIEQDPYFQANPREYRLLAWGKALPQCQVLV